MQRSLANKVERDKLGLRINRSERPEIASARGVRFMAIALDCLYMQTYTSNFERQEEIAMNFKKATDELLSAVTLQDLAGDMDVSVQSLRQARATEDSTAYRSPPVGWEHAVRDLANERMGHFRVLVAHMERQIRKGCRT